MAGADKSKLGYRILLGVVVLVLGGSMLLYLVPQSPVSGEISTDTVAKIGDESVSVQDVRQQLNQIEQRNPNMKALEPLYAQQILKQLGVEGQESLHIGIALLDLVELLADVLHADRLISDLGDGVRGDLATDRRLRNEVEQHAASQDQNDGPQKDAVPKFAFIFCASHPMNLPRQ